MKNCTDVDDDDFKFDDDDGGADHRYRNAKPGKVGSKVLLAIVSLLVLLRLLNIAIVLRYFIWGIRDKVPEVRRRMAVRTLAASSFLVAALAVPSVYYSCFSFNFRASITCAFQSAFFAIWLVARDRSLQSPFFRTPLKYLYITGALAVVRFTLIILSSGNFTADNDGGYYHQPGFTLYILFDVSNGVGVLTCLIMSYQFLKPLAGYRPEGMTSAVIKEVILRTGIGALAVVLFLCVYLIAEHYWLGNFLNRCGEAHKGATSQSLQTVIVGAFSIPELLHINISHRDDRLLLWSLKWLCSKLTESFKSVVCTRRSEGDLSSSVHYAVFVPSESEEDSEIMRLSALSNSSAVSFEISETEAGKTTQQHNPIHDSPREATTNIRMPSHTHDG